MENLETLLLAAEEGNIDAMVDASYHILFELPKKDISEDLIQKAKDFLNRAILAKNDYAMLNTGAMFYSGIHCEQDFAKAVYWYSKAAKLGNAQAICNLGYCHYYGRSIPKNYEKAFQCFTKSALMGNYEAVYKLGDMYLNGIYVEKDKDFAFRLYVESFQIHMEDPSLQSYPDILLRISRMLQEVDTSLPSLSLAKEMLETAIQSLKERIARGDRFSNKLLDNALQDLQALQEQVQRKTMH